jgi:hypothetical protein
MSVDWESITSVLTYALTVLQKHRTKDLVVDEMICAIDDWALQTGKTAIADNIRPNIANIVGPHIQAVIDSGLIGPAAPVAPEVPAAPAAPALVPSTKCACFSWLKRRGRVSSS